MDIIPFLSPETLSNTYVVTKDGKNAVIIDPSSSDIRLIQLIEDKKLNVEAYLITQSLRAHNYGLGVMNKIYPAPIYSPEYIPSVKGIRKVSGGSKIAIASMSIEAISILGPMPPVNVYKIDNAIFTGETILAGSVAKTANPSAKELLLKEIREKLLTLENNTLVFPAKGPVSKIRIEKMFNGDLLESQADYI